MIIEHLLCLKHYVWYWNRWWVRLIHRGRLLSWTSGFSEGDRHHSKVKCIMLITTGREQYVGCWEPVSSGMNSIREFRECFSEKVALELRFQGRVGVRWPSVKGRVAHTEGTACWRQWQQELGEYAEQGRWLSLEVGAVAGERGLVESLPGIFSLLGTMKGKQQNVSRRKVRRGGFEYHLHFAKITLLVTAAFKSWLPVS